MSEGERTTNAPAGDFLSGESEMSALMRAYDWAETPLGPPDGWPQSLQTVVRILLTSRYAMWMGWGPELTFLYNAAYAEMTLGAKHPRALGKPANVVWREIWKDIEPRVRTVLETGSATWDEALMLFLERSGYTEETYHTFSYSPLADDEGTIAGLFCVVTEETDRVIGERRLWVLRDVATRMGNSRTTPEVFDGVLAALDAHGQDAPFTLTYLIDDDGGATLSARTGISADHAAAVESIHLDADNAPWPLARVIETGETVEVGDLAERFGELPTGPWERPPATALVSPIAQRGQDKPIGVFIVGLNPYLLPDDAYRGFIDVLVGQIAGGLANARAYEEERLRADALAELDRAKTAFFNNVSHEFRTPLTLLLGPAEDALQDAATTPDNRHRLDVIHRNALRLQKLVNTLLDFSRIEAGRMRASYEATDLSTITTELASMFDSATERAGVALVVDAPPLPDRAYVDREMWEKIVLNLLSNAFKFTFAGSIRVELRERDGNAELTVRDTGTGIPETDLPHLFERFHRVDGARGRTNEGSGIGLALVRELVKLHGGSIRVDSEVGRGTAFTVSMPLGTAHLPADRIDAGHELVSTAIGAAPFVEEALRWLPDDETERPERVDEDASSGVGATPGRPADDGAYILVADDNADMRDYVRRLLAGRWRVTTVADGLTALEYARERPPDLVLSDVMMPGLDGFELLRELRSDARTREVPVLLLSARAGEEARIVGLQAGADDYLVKPFSARELLARVESQLELARVRREGSAALRESEERFRNMADHAPVMIWVTDPSAECTYLNRRWCEFTGQTLEEGLGFGWLDAVHPDDHEAAHSSLVLANEHHDAWRKDYRLLREDGEYRWVSDAAGPRFDSEGGFLGYIGSVIDITERRQAEEVREQLLASEREARHEAEEANQAKANFLATMSHELRTPLNAIIGFADLLDAGVAGPLTSGQRSQLERIDAGARHLLRIIEEILTFSRIEAGREEVHVERVDLAEVVRETARLIEPLVRSKGLRFAVRAPDRPIVAETDAGKVRQVLLNLMSNAAKFTETGEVKVELSASGDGATIVVRDTGIGIPPDQIARIFEPFRQVAQGHAHRAEGTGLGLSVSRHLARLLGGDVSAASTPGAGSALTFTLPLSPPPADPSD